MSTSRRGLGGVIHTYQKYDPLNIPGPTPTPPDMAAAALEHLFMFGNTRELTDAELARAVHIDPSQIVGLGPSLDALLFMLRERKRRILATYETDHVLEEAARAFHEPARAIQPTEQHARRFREAVRDEQIFDLERLWYALKDERSRFARQLVQLIERLGEKYQVDELASKYEFTGRTLMTVPEALEIKRELETIDKLIGQLEEAAKSAQIGVIDLEELVEFAEPGQIENLSRLQRQIEDYLKALAEQQGLERDRGGYRLTPRAYRLVQSRLLAEIFSELDASRSGRHSGPVVGDGAVEMQRTKPFEFGDSITHMDITTSMLNAMLRNGPGLPIRLEPRDIAIHQTRNNPKCATVVLLDMSGSMRYGGQYINVKRMGLALDGLIHSEYPGDFLQFVEVFTFAKPRHISEIPQLMPKPVTLYDPVVRLKADMSDANISELDVPWHFTNIQHGLQLGRKFLSAQDTPNRQIILITDGLPTAHFEGSELFMLYPPTSRTEQATMREASHCAREAITINIFLLPSWNQSRDDVQFAYRMAENTKGRVFFTAGNDLDRYVLWDYLHRRKRLIS